MSDKILDEIEKSIDDFCVDDKKELNSSVSEISQMDEIYKRLEQQIERQRFEEETEWERKAQKLDYIEKIYQQSQAEQQERLREFESQIKRHRTSIVKCRCGTNIEIITDGQYDIHGQHNYMGDSPKSDSFRCPVCTDLWRTVGKIKELRIKMER